MIISVSLRRIYPGGVLARDFDATGLSKKEKTSPGSSSKKGSALVYPVCQVDGDLEAQGEAGAGSVKGTAVCGEGGPPEGCEMVGRGEDGGAEEGGAQSVEGEVREANQDNQEEPNQQQERQEEREGCCVMLLDECDVC